MTVALIINFILGTAAGACFGFSEQAESPKRRATLSTIGIILMVLIVIVAVTGAKHQ